jgi:hypothetical protein
MAVALVSCRNGPCRGYLLIYRSLFYNSLISMGQVHTHQSPTKLSSLHLDWQSDVVCAAFIAHRAHFPCVVNIPKFYLCTCKNNVILFNIFSPVYVLRTTLGVQILIFGIISVHYCPVAWPPKKIQPNDPETFPFPCDNPFAVFKFCRLLK